MGVALRRVVGAFLTPQGLKAGLDISHASVSWAPGLFCDEWKYLLSLKRFLPFIGPLTYNGLALRKLTGAYLLLILLKHLDLHQIEFTRHYLLVCLSLLQGGEAGL